MTRWIVIVTLPGKRIGALWSEYNECVGPFDSFEDGMAWAESLKEVDDSCEFMVVALNDGETK